jgi:hypothetical protein
MDHVALQDLPRSTNHPSSSPAPHQQQSAINKSQGFDLMKYLALQN